MSGGGPHGWLRKKIALPAKKYLEKLVYLINYSYLCSKDLQ